MLSLDLPARSSQARVAGATLASYSLSLGELKMAFWGDGSGNLREALSELGLTRPCFHTRYPQRNFSISWPLYAQRLGEGPHVRTCRPQHNRLSFPLPHLTAFLVFSWRLLLTSGHHIQGAPVVHWLLFCYCFTVVKINEEQRLYGARVG